MEEMADLYNNFRRIPTYVMVAMVFTILQFVVVTALGVYLAVQMHRIAEVMESTKPKNNGTWGPGVPPGYGQQPPQYGPRQP